MNDNDISMIRYTVEVTFFLMRDVANIKRSTLMNTLKISMTEEPKIL